MEQRHVIVEDVAVLHQPARPSPHHVQVLRLVAVDAITKNGHDAQQRGGGHAGDEGRLLGGAPGAQARIGMARQENVWSKAQEPTSVVP